LVTAVPLQRSADFRKLEGKRAGVFTSTGSLHGGQETTILTPAAPLKVLNLPPSVVR
jgi:multimeric flavodoxin WrbA